MCNIVFDRVTNKVFRYEYMYTLQMLKDWFEVYKYKLVLVYYNI